jgi:hypothetical protein
MVLGYNNDDGAQALDQQQEIDFRRGWQVVDADSGSNVVTAGTGSYDVDVAAGDINTPTGTVTCSAATLDLESLVDPDLPRIVLVYRDASGVAQTLAGTPAAKQPTGETSPGPIYQPAPDAFSTTDGVVLATVLLEAAASSVGSAQIRDRRMPASLTAESAEVGSLSAEEASITKDAVQVYNSSTDQTIADSTVTTVELDSVQYDNLGAADLSNNQIVIQNAGTYIITGMVRWANDSGWSTGDRFSARIKADSTYGPTYQRKVGTGSQITPAVPAIAELNSGESITMEVFQSSGADKILDHGSRTFTRLEVGRLG